MNVVPKRWPGATFAILAGGPSLTQADVDTVKASGCRIIAIKDAIRLCPDADVFYCCGADPGRWWQHHAKTLDAFAGLRFTLDPKAAAYATVLKHTGQTGLELDPTGLRTGKNSGYQAINLAVHLGAARILLLGYDMRKVDGRDHWFGGHPYTTNPPPYTDFLQCFPSLVQPLASCGVEVINVTPQSALKTFPRVSLSDALAQVAA